jgi:hypothetical protein
MTEDHKGKSLACLGDCPGDVRVFNEAYDAVRLNFKGVNMETVKEKYPDIYGYEEEQLVISSVETVRLFTEVSPEKFEEVIQRLVRGISPDLRMSVCQELEGRNVIASDMLGLFKAEIEMQEAEIKQEIEDRGGRPAEEAGQVLERARQVLGDLIKPDTGGVLEELKNVSEGIPANVGDVPVKALMGDNAKLK